ncbi:MAG: ATP-binding protein [Syntrophobacteraceae bacterium]|jgi:signal transduction histidine kinase|nr:ATP-binding protein [Syntrophobacteraceae bacterium]
MLLSFLFALAPVCAVGILSTRTAEELILTMVANQIDQVTADKAALLERWIGERKADIELMAHSSIMQSMSPDEIESYLRQVKRAYRVYREIRVVPLDGAAIGGFPGSSATVEEERWFQEAAAGRLYMSDIRLDAGEGESFFMISAPRLARNGQIDGVVCARVGTGTILEVILRVSLGSTGESYLVDREGTFLAHKEPGRILTENIAQSESFRNIFGESRERRTTYVDYRGIEVIGASRRVGGTDWVLVVEQDREEAFHSADALERYILLVISLSIVGVFLSAWLLSRVVAEPIRRLSDAATHLAQGDFETVVIDTRRRDEIGRLYTVFDHMARQLMDRQQRLEKRVILREAELKETDVKLKRSQEAAARSQQLAALGQLAAGVAHEIRTPLTSLKMFLESIERELEFSSECEEDFQVAASQILRMEATINRFLDFAKPREPVWVEIDVEELIQDALLIAGPRAKQQETLLGTRLTAPLPRISVDRKQLGEALLNLMVNGLEAVGDHGRITVSASVETLERATGPQDCVRIDVSDTGPGIDPEHIPRLFDPFFTTKATGTGLGLSIVYTTVRRHGGEVRMKNDEGEGVTFSMLIPVQSGHVMEDDGKNSDR